MSSHERRIAEVQERIGEITPVSHALHDYFLESLGVAERIVERMKIPRSTKENGTGNTENGASAREESELEFLLTFLEEELDVAAGRKAARYREVVVTDRGMIGDRSTDNGPALRSLLTELTELTGGSEYVRLVFPPGVYYVSNDPGRPTIELEGLEHVTLEGRGSVTILCDGRIRSLLAPVGAGGTPSSGASGPPAAAVQPQDNVRINRCVDVELRNLTLDTSPLPFTVGTITEVASGNQIVIEILPGYPEPDESYWTAKFGRGVVKDPETGRIRRDCGDPRVADLERLAAGRYGLRLDDNALSGRTDLTANFQVGALFSLHPRQRPGAGNGLTITSCRHLLFSRFDVHSTDSHAYGIATSAGVKFLDCAIEPAPGRVSMTNADAFHCRSNAKGIYLERCRVLLMNDDCMNFYSKLASVGEVEEDRRFTVLQTAMQNESMSNFRVGDAIAFVNSNNGEMDGTAVITAIETIEWGGQEGIMRLSTDRAISSIVSRRDLGRPDFYAEREYTQSGADNYRAAMEIDAPFEHMVLNLNAKNDGFIIRNCTMGHNRATGFKCKATNGVMRNTRFHDQLLLFQTEPDWQEGTFPGYIEMTDVIADRGIRYQATLPGKQLTGPAAARHIHGVRFERVRDSAGKDIPSPEQARDGEEAVR